MTSDELVKRLIGGGFGLMVEEKRWGCPGCGFEVDLQTESRIWDGEVWKPVWLAECPLCGNK